MFFSGLFLEGGGSFHFFLIDLKMDLFWKWLGCVQRSSIHFPLNQSGKAKLPVIWHSI